MNVRDLIEQLEQFDPDMRIVVDGYEDGFNDIHFIRTAKAIINHDVNDFYNGDHAAAYNEEDAKWYEETTDCRSEDIVYIPSMKLSAFKKMLV